jgi:two-component system sensor histidine kinase KdpD
MRSKTPRIAIVLAAIAALTFALFRLVSVNSTTAGFAYLVAILFIAARWGLVEAIVGSIASVLCLNFFFLPPIGTLTIADPQNWVALFAFLATGITASQLSAQIRRRALEAQNRQQEVEKLYALSRSILLAEPLESVPRRLADQVSQSFGARAVALYDGATGSLYRSGPEDFPNLDDRLKQAAVQGTFFQNTESGTLITAIRLGAEPIGSLGIFGVELSDSALQSLVNLVAIGLERARAQEAASRAEAARQSEELKSTLLDAIAHEFKTPLTTIKAATTALLSSDLSRLERQRGFLAIIDEEADRLNGLISDAIQMARLEAGSVRLNREQCSIGEIVARVVESMKPALRDSDIKIAVPQDLPDLSADAELIALTVRQLIDNAIKYSPARSLISIRAERRGESLTVSVADRGPGIPEAEQPRVFEKFYRGRDSCNNQIPGAGLGLAIAREIVHAHGGEIWVESRSGGGSVFRFSLPVEGAGESE